jgi:TetR/AcrR family transcriptional regulator, transcriptional repressor of bet genes
MKSQKKRTQIKDIRRSELIQAAHRVFMVHGLDGLTTQRICAEAGLSAGILAYYFRGKDEVLFAMVRHNNRVLSEEVVLRLREAGTPWDRVMAVIEGNFPEAAFTPPIAQAWLSVCARAGADADYARLQVTFYRRLQSNLVSALSGVVTGERLSQVVLGMGVMIDGLWLRKAAGGDQTRADAIALLVGHVQAMLGAEEIRALQKI